MLRGLTAAALVAALLRCATPPPPRRAVRRCRRSAACSGRSRQQTAGQDEADGPTTEQVLRIERLEAQIRQLTGTIEQLQYRNQQLEKQLRGCGGAPALSRRSRRRSAAAPVATSAAGPAMRPAPARAGSAAAAAAAGHGTPLRRVRSVAESQCARRAAPARQHAERAAADRHGRAAGRRARRPPGRRAARSVDAVAARRRRAGGRRTAASCRRRRRAISAPPARWPRSRRRRDSPKDNYDLGYGYVLRKDYALAEDTFQAFLKKYPTDRRAADAQFWLGESLFQRQRYDAAAQAFLDLSTKYAQPRQGAGGAAAARPVARGPEAEGNGLRHARRGRPQISAKRPPP